MESLETLYFGDLRSKIENAHRLRREFGERLAADPEFRASLGRLVRFEEKVRGVMRSMGLFELCAECGEQAAGGCCSARMANETDSMLLLINLCAGFEVSRRRDDDQECCFLGRAGCSLKFKPFYCLNYLCRKIHADSSARDLARLRSASSALLGQLLVVEELILARLSAEL